MKFVRNNRVKTDNCMCLIINKKIHPNCQPIFAETDLLVYKVLTTYKISPTEYKYLTPYRLAKIKFINGKSKLVSFMTSLVYNDSVEVGLHSYQGIRKAKGAASVYEHDKSFFAVIPKGSYFFFGSHGDIVSTELIIFETVEAYKKYAKSHEVKEAKDLFKSRLEESKVAKSQSIE